MARERVQTRVVYVLLYSHVSCFSMFMHTILLYVYASQVVYFVIKSFCCSVFYSQCMSTVKKLVSRASETGPRDYKETS